MKGLQDWTSGYNPGVNYHHRSQATTQKERNNVAIRGGKVRSMKALKAGLKKGSGLGYLSRVPADGSVTVRFLTEPNEWVEYYEHFDQVKKFYPCTDDCDGCRAGESPSRRYLANALDVAENKVIPLVLPKSLAGSVTKKYDKYATLLDRDYELTREGTGFDTEYDVTPEPPSKVNIGRYDLLDLWALLEAQLESEDEEDDEDEDEKPRAKRGTKAAPAKRRAVADDDDDEDEDDEDDDEDEKPAPKSRRAAPTRKAAVEEDEDEDEDEEDEDEAEDDDADVWTRDDLDGKGIRELRKIALEAGWTTDDYKGLDVEGVIDLILQEEGDEEAEDEDEEEGDLTEDDLKAMSLAELKELAKEYGVKVKPSIAKADLIDLILDAAGEEEGDDEPPF